MQGNKLIVNNSASMPEAIKPTVKTLRELEGIEPLVELHSIFVQVPRVTREHRGNIVTAAKQVAARAKGNLHDLFSEYSKKAKSRDFEGSGVSKDLIHAAVDNSKFDIDRRIEQLDSLLKKRKINCICIYLHQVWVRKVM